MRALLRSSVERRRGCKSSRKESVLVELLICLLVEVASAKRSASPVAFGRYGRELHDAQRAYRKAVLTTHVRVRVATGVV